MINKAQNTIAAMMLTFKMILCLNVNWETYLKNVYMKFGRSKREKLKRCCHVWIPKSVTQNICAVTVGKQR